MYQQVITSETIVDLTTPAKSYLRLLNNTVEDTLITEQLTVALKQAEQKCNRAFSAKSMVIKCDKNEFALLGIIDTTKTITVKVDGTATTNYTITGDVQPSIEILTEGLIYQVEYTTLADLPLMVKQWVYQTLQKLFDRNASESQDANDKLLEPYINLVWLP